MKRKNQFDYYLRESIKIKETYFHFKLIISSLLVLYVLQFFFINLPANPPVAADTPK